MLHGILVKITLTQIDFRPVISPDLIESNYIWHEKKIKSKTSTLREAHEKPGKARRISFHKTIHQLHIHPAVLTLHVRLYRQDGYYVAVPVSESRLEPDRHPMWHACFSCLLVDSAVHFPRFCACRQVEQAKNHRTDGSCMEYCDRAWCTFRFIQATVFSPHCDRHR